MTNSMGALGASSGDPDRRTGAFADFEQQNYAIFRDAIDPRAIKEVSRFLAGECDTALVRLQELGLPGDFSGQGERIAEFLETEAGKRLSREDVMLFTGHFPLETRLSPKIRAIPMDPGLQAAIKTVLHTDRLCMHMPPTARFILPGNSAAAVPPHQDYAYNEHMGSFVTVWVPLVEIDDRCGGVTVYRGSQHSARIPVAPGGPMWLEGTPTAGFEAERCVPMSPGDALMFGPQLIHASMANTSDRPRISIDFRFFPATASSTKHYLDLTTGVVVAPGTH